MEHGRTGQELIVSPDLVQRQKTLGVKIARALSVHAVSVNLCAGTLETSRIYRVPHIRGRISLITV
jgi:hypothetical protein